MTKIISSSSKLIFALIAMALCLQIPAHSINRTTITPLSVQSVRPSAGLALKSTKPRAFNRRTSAKTRVKVSIRTSASNSKRMQHSATAGGAKSLMRRKIAAKTTRAKVVKKAPAMSFAQRTAIQRMFRGGSASALSPTQLVAAGVFKAYPLRGGVFKRKNWPSTLVIHSTETARVATARAIVRSWNNGGAYHAGTQYIIDRDGVIYQTVDPAYATYHVDSSKTLLGVKNENSIGIETVRTADQYYTDEQMKSLTCLSHYLKAHFSLRQIVGHGQVQPSDRSDPVLFDWTAFRQGLGMLDDNQIAFKKAASRKA